jgi:RNA polymerase sigma-70 factor, ECF subfamily
MRYDRGMAEPAQLPDDETDIGLAARGDAASWQRLTERYRDKLRAMVAYRLDKRVQARLDASDIVQEAFLDAANRLPEFAATREVPFFIWMRALVQQRVGMAHRDHLGRAKRSAAREVEPPTFDSSRAIALALLDKHVSPSEDVRRKELGEKLKSQLDLLEPLDREVLMLRHFEHLTNSEVAMTLNLSAPAASQRYGRALRRLKDIMVELLGHSIG